MVCHVAQLELYPKKWTQKSCECGIKRKGTVQIKTVIASVSEAIHRRLPRKSDDFLAMTGVKVASKPAKFHLPLAMTGVKVASKPAKFHLPLAMTFFNPSQMRGVLLLFFTFTLIIFQFCESFFKLCILCLQFLDCFLLFFNCFLLRIKLGTYIRNIFNDCANLCI